MPRREAATRKSRGVALHRAQTTPTETCARRLKPSRRARQTARENTRAQPPASARQHVPPSPLQNQIKPPGLAPTREPPSRLASHSAYIYLKLVRGPGSCLNCACLADPSRL